MQNAGTISNSRTVMTADNLIDFERCAKKDHAE